MFGTVFFNKASYRSILFASYIGNTIGLFLTAYTSNFKVMAFSRVFSGFCQVFHPIYHPVYGDTYGTRKTKTLIISVNLLATPLGIVIGYILTSSMSSWRFAFMLVGMMCTMLGIIFLCFPVHYTEVDIALKLLAKERAKRNCLPSADLENINNHSNKE